MFYWLLVLLVLGIASQRPCNLFFWSWPELMLAMKVWVEYWSACILFVYDQFINCQTIIEIIECMQYKYVLYNYNCIQICQSRVLFCRGIRKSCGCSGNLTLAPLRRICRIREDLCLWVYRMFVFFVSYRYVRIKRESMCRVGVSGESVPTHYPTGTCLLWHPSRWMVGYFILCIRTELRPHPMMTNTDVDLGGAPSILTLACRPV